MKETDEKGHMDSYIICENLIHDLIEADVGEKGCPVVLVGHFIGCLIMKELCTQLSARLPQNPRATVKNLFHSVQGLFYYACPHHGSELADNSREHLRGPLCEELTTLNKLVERRNEDFRKLRREYGWRTFGIGEGRPTTFKQFTGFIVQEGSGRLDVDGFYTADCDHFDVCQPESTTSSRFCQLSKLISEVLEKDKKRHSPKICIPDGTVGLERRIKQAIEMLQETQRLGIVGMGGIGKTTLAKAVYESIKSNFEYSCFLADVKIFMTSKENTELLRQKILQNLSHRGREIERSFKWDMLIGKEVLIVLDDVEFRSQIQVMIGSDGFSDTSRVIVTSRDSGFLTREKFICHPVETLDNEESEKLFSLNAFNERDSVLNDQKERVMRFVRKCGGLPLALRVMGKYLKGETEAEVWGEVLMKFQKAQPPDGQREDELWSLLQLSYNSLQEEEQQMFLDIAVCFHGEELDFAKQAWKVCGWASPHTGLKNLVTKCLVTTEKRNIWDEELCIRMHEVLRALGQNIAGQSRVCIRSPLAGSRPFDVSMMKAKHAVKVLKICRRYFEPGLHISIQALHGLEGLKILWLDGVSLHGPCSLLPPNLASMRLADVSWTSFDPGFFNQAQCSRPRFLPLSSEHFGEHPNLRHLEIRSSYISPDVRDTLGELQALEYLRVVLQDWDVLAKALGQLSSLKYLLIQDCCRVTTHRPFSIPWCDYLKALVDLLGQLQGLQRFILHRCPKHGDPSLMEQLELLDCLARKGLLQGVGQLDLPIFDIKFLSLESGCESLESVPGTLGLLTGLERHRIVGCEGLKALPDSLGGLEALKIFYLKSCDSLESLPGTLGLLTALEDLRIVGCKGLKALPDSLGDLQALKIFCLHSCNSLESLPGTLGLLTALEDLRIVRCKGLKALPDSLGDLQALKIFYLHSCDSLESLPGTLGLLTALEDLSIVGCRGLKALPDSLGGLQALESFHLESYDALESPPGTPGLLTDLEDLTIEWTEIFGL